MLEYARDYSCDGCYEPMFTGASDFKFAYINLLKAVMYALNAGGDYQAAGPLHLAGDASSWRTPLAKDIRTFDQFQVNSRMQIHSLYCHPNLYIYICVCVCVNQAEIYTC